MENENETKEIKVRVSFEDFTHQPNFVDKVNQFIDYLKFVDSEWTEVVEDLL